MIIKFGNCESWKGRVEYCRDQNEAAALGASYIRNPLAYLVSLIHPHHPVQTAHDTMGTRGLSKKVGRRDRKKCAFG